MCFRRPERKFHETRANLISELEESYRLSANRTTELAPNNKLMCLG